MAQELEPQPQVGIIVRALIFHEGKILLVQRAQNDRWKPLHWELPGGKKDQGENEYEAVRRETLQETSLKIEPKYQIYQDQTVFTEGPRQGQRFCMVAFKAIVPTQEVALSEEHSAYMWVTLREALTQNLTPESKRIIETFNLHFLNPQNSV